MCPIANAAPRPTGDGSVGSIYVSAPIAITQSPEWHTALAHLRQRYSKSTLVLPTVLFRSRLEWRTRVAAVIRQVERLVFLTDSEGFVGKGVFHEITVALTLGKSVEMLTELGELIAYADLAIGAPDRTNWSRYCHVERGTLRGAV